MVTVATWNLENLYRPGGPFGPRTEEAYDKKLQALAGTIDQIRPDVLGVQEVGAPEALADLVERLDGRWHTVLSGVPDGRGIRVGVLSRLEVQASTDVVDVPAALARVPTDDPPAVGPDIPKPMLRLARGILHTRVATVSGAALDVVVCHLKSKLITYPGNRFAPRDEGERARYAAYALFRRTVEAASLRSWINGLLDGRGTERAVVVCGDLNDVPEAATTQVLLGPAGSEIGTVAALRPDQGDPWRLWNIAPLIPAERRFSRIFQGRRELIDHILVSRALLERVQAADSLTDRPLPTVTEEPVRRRDAEDSDHAPVVARLDISP